MTDKLPRARRKDMTSVEWAAHKKAQAKRNYERFKENNPTGFKKQNQRSAYGWRERNPEEYREYQREYQRKYREERPEEYAKHQKAYRDRKASKSNEIDVQAE